MGYLFSKLVNKETKKIKKTLSSLVSIATSSLFDFVTPVQQVMISSHVKKPQRLFSFLFFDRPFVLVRLVLNVNQVHSIRLLVLNDIF